MIETMRKIVALVFIVGVFGFSTVLIVGSRLADVAQTSVGIPPAHLNAEQVLIGVPTGEPVSGWFTGANSSQGSILLLHGVRSNRTSMIERARFLLNAGYAVLMIDMQAHGETPGSNITFGYLESVGVHRAVEYLRSRLPGQPIGIIGVSLGGAAALLRDAPVKVDAVVLEGVYASIDVAIKNRIEIRLGPLGRYLSFLLSWQIEPRLGFSADLLSPLEAISNLSGAVMIVAGSADRHTRLSETRALFDRAQEPKQLWIVEGAVHQDLHQYARAEYESRVLSFFQKHLNAE